MLQNSTPALVFRLRMDVAAASCVYWRQATPENALLPAKSTLTISLDYLLATPISWEQRVSRVDAVLPLLSCGGQSPCCFLPSLPLHTPQTLSIRLSPSG